MNRLRLLSRSSRGHLVLTFRFRLRPGDHFDGRRPVLPLPPLEPLQVLHVLPLPPPVAEAERTRGLVATEQDIGPQTDVIQQERNHPLFIPQRNEFGQKDIKRRVGRLFPCRRPTVIWNGYGIPTIRITRANQRQSTRPYGAA